MGGVEEHNLAEFRCGGRCDNLAVKTVLHQFGNPSAVIDVGVGQKEGFNLLWMKTPILPVPILHELTALEKAAVYQNLFAAGAFNKVIRSGN